MLKDWKTNPRNSMTVPCPWRFFSGSGAGVLCLLAILSGGMCSLFPGNRVLAAGPDEILEDSVLEARARDLGRQLRCVTCQGQSIEDSAAPLAKDLRILVRRRLLDGDTDREVVAYLTQRYGDYIRLRPAMRASTALLWLLPVLLLLAGGGMLAVLFRGRGYEDGPS